MARKDKKFFIGKLKIQSGEYEFYSTFVFQTSSPDSYLKRLAKTFYGNKAEEVRDNTFYFNSCAVAVTPDNYQIISKTTFNAIKFSGVINEL